MRILSPVGRSGPSRDVAGNIDARKAGLEIDIHSPLAPRLFQPAYGRGAARTGAEPSPVLACLATFRRKKHAFEKVAPGSGRPRLSDKACRLVNGRRPGLRAGLLGHGAADVEQIVGDHAEANPALHAGLASVSAAVQPVPSLGHGDAAFAAGPPL